MGSSSELLKMIDDSAYICETCGTQHPPSKGSPSVCVICLDERQFLPKGGQRWVMHGPLKRGGGFHNMWEKLEPGLYGISTTPRLGIGQRAILLQTPQGNVLWDCISFLDEATIDIVKALGGLRAIAISHPHFYASHAQWSATFGDIPVYIHERDKEWVMFKHKNVSFWSGETQALWEGVQLHRLGGHFAGGAILHWASGANGKGAVLTADILAVTMDRQTVSVMRSFPNYLPLSASKAQRIGKIMEGMEFDRVYGAFFNSEIEGDGKAAVERSLNQYMQWVQHDDTDT